MHAIEVRSSRGAGGWTCEVTVSDAGHLTRHLVGVSHDDLARLAPGDEAPDRLVARSFEFLLARERQESILRSFDLPTIGRYFPDYEATIRN